MRAHRRLAIGMLCAILLSGCGTIGRVDYTPSPSSGVSDQQLKVLAVGAAGNVSEPMLTADPEIQEVLKGQCAPPAPPGVPKPALGAAVVPIISALGQLAVNQYFVQQQRRIEQIVESSKAAYSLTFDTSPAELAQTRCLVLVRHGSNADGTVSTIGLRAVIVLDTVAAGPVGTGTLKFRPIYVRATNAVAQTRQSAEPAISVSIGLSIKAVAPQRADGIARLVPTGEGAVGVSNVILSGASSQARCVTKVCKSSDLLPYPTTRGRLSLTLAIAEQGETGFDDKAALADLAALKEALGPAIAEAIKAKFED